ncbi:hypothetical protein MACK_003652 [Theileria orientalis]|uniref:Uncharacterized protein n=1 Tax=Theileria orientalis TaxID=68886 RepID=A0A976SJH3_THEOR|nr:hypothetical protein MACK_003652 [Theileria orientalis]
MNSIYRCTILIFILLSQLDLFTSVEGAPVKAQGTGGRGNIEYYKKMAIAERDKNAGKSTRVTAAKSKARKVQVDPSTGAKTMDIHLDSFDESGDDDIVVVEQKMPQAKAQVVDATSGAPAGVSTSRPKYSVYTEERKIGAQTAPDAQAAITASGNKTGNQSRSEFIAQLQNIAADLNKQFEDLSAEVERRKAGGAPQAPKAEANEVLEEHKHDPRKVNQEVPKKPEYVTSVEVVRRPPKTSQPPMGQAHLPANIQAVAEATMPRHGTEGAQRGASAGEFHGDKMDLLHHKVDRVYSEIAILRHEQSKMSAKLDAFISAASTGGSVAAAAQAAAALESHAKHGAGQQAGARGDESISSYQLASQFPSGWHDHSFERSGITVDFTQLPTDNEMYEVKEHGDVVTCVFNRGKRVDDIRCAGATVWELGYTRTNSSYPKVARYNKKTLKILVNLEKLVLLYERDSDGKWQLAKEFKHEPIELTVKESDNTTNDYSFDADTAAGKFTYEAKDGKTFKEVKHGNVLVWRAEALIQCTPNVELRKYPDDMFGLTLHFMDRSELKIVKESANANWAIVDPTSVMPATVNVFSKAETFAYTIKIETGGVKLFIANEGFKFNKVIAKHGNSTNVICETQNQLKFAHVVEFDATEAIRKVILHFPVGSGTATQRKVFEETPTGWQAEGANSSQTSHAQPAGSAMGAALTQPVHSATPPSTPAMTASQAQAAPTTNLNSSTGQAVPAGSAMPASQAQAAPATTPPVPQAQAAPANPAAQTTPAQTATHVPTDPSANNEASAIPGSNA